MKVLFLCLLTSLASTLVAEPTKVEEREAQEKRAGLKVVNVTAEQAVVLLKGKEPPVVIDIRTAEEAELGRIEGAVVIDYRGKGFKAELVKLDRKKSYLFYCRSGGRSARSISIWKELGFQKVYHLESGYLGWGKVSK